MQRSRFDRRLAATDLDSSSFTLGMIHDSLPQVRVRPLVVHKIIEPDSSHNRHPFGSQRSKDFTRDPFYCLGHPPACRGPHFRSPGFLSMAQQVAAADRHQHHNFQSTALQSRRRLGSTLAPRNNTDFNRSAMAKKNQSRSSSASIYSLD